MRRSLVPFGRIIGRSLRLLRRLRLWRLVRRFRFAGRRSGQTRRPRGEHEAGGLDQVGLVRLRAPGLQRDQTGDPEGEERRPQRGNAEGVRDGAEGGDRVVHGLPARPLGRRPALPSGLVPAGRGGRAQAHAGEVDAQRQPVGEGLRDGLVLLPLVEQHEAEPGRQPRGETVPLQRQRSGIEGAREPGDGAALQPLGHRHEHGPAIGLRQQSALDHRPAGAQRRGQVEAADQPVVGDARRHPAHRASEPAAEVIEPEVAHRPGACPQHDPAETVRIGGEQFGGPQRIVPGPGRIILLRGHRRRQRLNIGCSTRSPARMPSLAAVPAFSSSTASTGSPDGITLVESGSVSAAIRAIEPSERMNTMSRDR
ncbi:hypothetical protein CHKEEEPN_0740 [Methylorubrum podarium]|nr:hypothetical protein CHKEEEPN_0740 [Methylorubrum podarium]